MDNDLSRNPIIKSNRTFTITPIFLLTLLSLAWIGYQVFLGLVNGYNFLPLSIAIGLSIFFPLLYFKIIPLADHQPQFLWLPLTLLAFACFLTLFFITDFPVGYAAVFMMCAVTILTLIEGRKTAYGLTALIALEYFFIALRARQMTGEVIQNAFILMPLGSILVIETLMHQRKTIEAETHRLTTLNNVARSLASSLEMHQVISLVTSAIQSSLPADTYYVGMLVGDSIHLELVYDDGEFFPSTNVPIKNTLSETVITKKQPLLISNVLKYRRDSGSNYQVIGQPHVSLSWMGTPLEAYGEAIGIIAVASYRKNSFTPEDLEMLVNIGQQASLALVNARHHTDVENRSQRDSLTGTLNHNAFVNMLEAQMREVKAFHSTLTVIMIDIDHFKLYNDEYGHLVGDHVLIEITKEVQRNIKKTDFMGRWGGEEFIVCLPDAQGQHAYQVASRIRSSIANINIRDRDNKSIPLPTISQGIAVYPYDCDTAEQLIDLADRRLYTAKIRGRDQVEPDQLILENTAMQYKYRRSEI
jgi:diguanylate cyclase (GGDEF)-like protein